MPVDGCIVQHIVALNGAVFPSKTFTHVSCLVAPWGRELPPHAGAGL